MGHHRTWYVAAAVVTTGTLAVVGAFAATDPLEIESLEAAEGYGEAQVTFSRGAFAPFDPEDATATPRALDAEAFVLDDVDPENAVGSVTTDADGEVYTLTFEGPVTPNGSEIRIVSDAVTDSDGDHPDGDLVAAITLRGDDAADQARGLTDLEFDVAQLGSLPLVGAWFRNEGPATSSSTTTQEMEASANQLANGPTTLTAEQAIETGTIGLIDLLPGLTDVAFDALEDQAELVAALEDVDGIATATFDADLLRLSFDGTDVAAADLTAEQATLTPETSRVPFRLDALTTFDIALDGVLELDLDLHSVPSVSSLQLDVLPQDLDVAIDQARIGMVSVDAPGLSFDSDAADPLVGSFATTCTDCGVMVEREDLDIGFDGRLTMTLPEVSFDGAVGGGTEDVTFDPAPTVTWLMDSLDLNVPDPDDVAPIEVEEHVQAFLDAGLDNFANLDARAVVLGLEWASSWLESTSQLDELDATLPAIGLSLGDVLDLSQQVGDEVVELVTAVEASAGPGEAADPSAQELFGLLCERDLLPCDADPDNAWGHVLEGIEIDTDRITYDLSFDVCDVLFGAEGSCAAPGQLPVGDGGPQLGLDLTADLDGFDVSLRAGTWEGTASAELAFRMVLDLRPDEDIRADLGIDVDDYPQPEVPEEYALEVGDICRTLSSLLETSPTRFQSLNDILAGEEGALADCDALAFDVAGGYAEVEIADEDATPHQVTAEDVCTAAALAWEVPLSAFRELNGGLSIADCAATVRTTILAGDTDGVYPGASFTYRPPLDDRVPLAFRVAIEPIDGRPLAAAQVAVAGRDLVADARLGFLDLTADGIASTDASVALQLTEPSNRLATLAASADAGDVDDLVDVAVSGPVELDVALTNEVVLAGAEAARLRLAVDLSDVLLAAGDHPWSVTEGDCDGTPDGVCYTLGDWTALAGLSADEAIAMVTRVLEQLAGLASHEVLRLEVPLLGASLQEMVELNRSVGVIADAVAARDPQSLTALAHGLETGLAAAGIDTEAHDVAIDVEAVGDDVALTVAVPLHAGSDRSYPLSLDLPSFVGGQDLLAIQPADGGARLRAGAQIAYEPKVGIVITDGDDLAERLYLDVDSDRDPVLAADAGADLRGDVTAGPVTVYLSGEAGTDPRVTLKLSELGTAGRLTSGEVASLLDGGLGREPADLLEVRGDLSLSAELDWPFGDDPSFTWDATLQQVLDGDVPAPTFHVAWDLSDITLDLETLVRGTTQTARFIGQGLARSEALGTSLPLVGDELTRMAAAGEDLRAIAAVIDDLWDDAEREADTFVADASTTLEASVCERISAAASDCSVELTLTDAEDAPGASIGQATGAQLTFDIGHEESIGVTSAELIDVPGLDLRLTGGAFTPHATVGYRLGLVLGLDIEAGFTLDGLEVDGTDATRLFEVYARAGISHDTAGDGGATRVSIGEIPVFDLDELDVALGGSLGGDAGDAAGFALEVERPLTFDDLSMRRGEFDRVLTPRLSVQASLGVAVRSPELFDGLPTIVLPVHFEWGVDQDIRTGVELPAPYLALGDPHADDGGTWIQVDATSLIDGVIRPALLEAAKYNPLAQAQPVRDALNQEIPVLDSDVRSVLELGLGREPAWQLFTFLLDLADIAETIQASDGAKPIDIGAYVILPRAADDPTGFVSAPGGDLWEHDDLAVFRAVLDRLARMTGSSGGFDPGSQPTVEQDLSTPQKAKGTSMSQFVSVPALSDPAALASLALGGELSRDVSFLEVAPPPIDFGYAVSFEQTLFDLDVAFLEASLSVGLDGAVGVTVRVGIGYSSRGLTTGNPFDGIYLVDAYDGQRDLPAIALGGRIGASVDGSFRVAGVASARFSGSGHVRLEGGLDLFDESLSIAERGRGDGKFHLDELLTVVDSHYIAGAPSQASFLCIFRPTVQLDASLRFSGEARVAGAKVWSGSFGDEWVLVDESITCPLKPRVAQLDDRDLILNAGPEYARDRFDGRGDDVDERFRVSQDADELVVTWRGTTPGGLDYEPLRFPIDEVERIVATFARGDNHVLIDHDVPVPAVLTGGSGNDVLVGGGGDDVIDGGGGRNYVAGTAGDNELLGGSAGPSTDPVEGEAPLGSCAATPDDLDDALGGIATDACSVVVAGAGDDLLLGGPRPAVYRLPGDDIGTNDLDHLGETAVIDLRDATAGVRGRLGAGGLDLQMRSDGTGGITAFEADSVARLVGTSGDDILRITASRDDLVVDGADGADRITVQATAVSQQVTVTDSGKDEAEHDTLIVRGTADADRYLLRAERSDGAADGAADRGLVAVLDPRSGTDEEPIEGDLQATDTDPIRYTGRAESHQLVRYDDSIDLLRVEGVAGRNEFGLDDVATETEIDGGRGDGEAGEPGNRFQIGQIFGWYEDEIDDGTGDQAPFRVPRNPEDPVTDAIDDIGLRTRESIRGWISYGVTHPTRIDGGTADDSFTVYSNREALTLEGVGGDNTFTLRAFIANGSITANGGVGDDTFNYDFEYVDNEDVNIDGGDGFNTFVAIGTELQDGFVVRDDGVSVCRIAADADHLDGRVRAGIVDRLPLQPEDATEEGDCGIQTSTGNIQRFVLYGLEGNNVFWARSTAADSETFLIGGRHGSAYVLGDDGDLSGFEGTIDVVADLLNLGERAEQALRSVDLNFPPPILFEGEVAYSTVDALIPEDAVDEGAEHRTVVDASGMPAQAGEMVVEPDQRDDTDDAYGGRISGLNTAEPDRFSVGTGGAVPGPPYPGGLGFRGLDLLRVVLGEEADELTVVDTHVDYEITRDEGLAADTPAGADPSGPVGAFGGVRELAATMEDPAEDEPDPLDELLERILDGMDGSQRAGRTEIHAGDGDDGLQVDAISAATWIELDAGANRLRVGTDDAAVTDVRADLEVLGGLGSDDVEVDASAGTLADAAVGLRVDLDLLRDEPDLRRSLPADDPADEQDDDWEPAHDRRDVVELTELEMPGLIRHDEAVDVFRIVTGGDTDVVNVRGTLASDQTQLRTSAADDRVFVSTAARLGLVDATPGELRGHLDDLLGDLDLDAGDGENLLMVSDRDGTAPRTAALSEDTFAIDRDDDAALGRVTFDAAGDFTPGVTAWLSDAGHDVEVTGARRDGDVDAIMAWEDPDLASGGPRTVTTLSTGDGDDQVTVDVDDGDGLLVVNLEAGDDELLGGDSTRGFVVFGGDGADRIQTGAGDDVVFGDVGRIEYRDSGGQLLGVLGVPDRMDLVSRRALAPETVATCTAQPTVSAAGAVDGCHDGDGLVVSHTRSHDGLQVDGIGEVELRNWLSLGDGDDVAFGGAGSDWIEATGGRDALLGDLGEVRRIHPDVLGGPQTVETNDGFIDVEALDGSHAYIVDVHDEGGGAADVILAGNGDATDGGSWLFGGIGDDVIVGGDADDVIFGGDGHDAIWGGEGDDRIYSGSGDSLVDLKWAGSGPASPRGPELRDGWPIGGWWPGSPVVPPAGWPALAPDVDVDTDPDSDNGSDLIYGGDGQDSMQADVGGAGPVPGDRLVDWYGAHNAYYVCDGAYGAGRVLRQPSPGMVAALRELAVLDGAYAADEPSTSGARQLAIPDGGNRTPIHPNHPANHHPHC